MRYEYLSHLLTESVPARGGKVSLELARTGSIPAGGSANTCRFLMSSHWGTHVDAPNHFFENGRRPCDYPPEFWFFKNPHIVKVKLAPSEILEPGEWMKSIELSCDILIFQSGWTKLRGEEKYSVENPGIHPDVGIRLRENFPRIKAIGIDWVSISSYRNRPLGREAHKAFLNPEGGNRPILIIEDMDLSRDLTGLAEVTVLPLRVAGADSAPCTIVGGFSD